MASFKVVVADPESGKSVTYELKDQRAQIFLGARISEVIDASTVGIPGKIRITGGTDRAGFPMCPWLPGAGKSYVLLPKGFGFKRAEEGERRRRLLRGKLITEDIAQINARLVK